jgi:hypothetical protein
MTDPRLEYPRLLLLLLGNWNAGSDGCCLLAAIPDDIGAPDDGSDDAALIE